MRHFTMKLLFVLLLCIISATNSSIIILAPLPSQYHAQDVFGQYSYGYSGGPSAKQETHTADGITQGGYSYVDSNGVLQTVNYVSDPVHGFRVAATNIPKPVTGTKEDLIDGPPESPEVLAAKLAHFEAHDIAKAKLRKARSVVYTPAVQYQAIDPIGNYAYGYNDGLSAKAETRTSSGTTNGAYSYVDDEGQVQSVRYVADSLGFRVTGTNTPIGPKNLPLELPVVPTDTPEVIQARAEHLAAFKKIQSGQYY